VQVYSKPLRRWFWTIEQAPCVAPTPNVTPVGANGWGPTAAQDFQFMNNGQIEALNASGGVVGCVAADSLAAGEPLSIQACVSTSSTQLWNFQGGQIVAQNADLCWEAPAQGQTGSIVLESCASMTPIPLSTAAIEETFVPVNVSLLVFSGASALTALSTGNGGGGACFTPDLPLGTNSLNGGAVADGLLVQFQPSNLPGSHVMLAGQQSANTSFGWPIAFQTCPPESGEIGGCTMWPGGGAGDGGNTLCLFDDNDNYTCAPTEYATVDSSFGDYNESCSSNMLSACFGSNGTTLAACGYSFFGLEIQSQFGLGYGFGPTCMTYSTQWATAVQGTDCEELDGAVRPSQEWFMFMPYFGSIQF